MKEGNGGREIRRSDGITRCGVLQLEREKNRKKQPTHEKMRELPTLKGLFSRVKPASQPAYAQARLCLSLSSFPRANYSIYPSKKSRKGRERLAHSGLASSSLFSSSSWKFLYLCWPTFPINPSSSSSFFTFFFRGPDLLKEFMAKSTFVWTKLGHALSSLLPLAYTHS